MSSRNFRGEGEAGQSFGLWIDVSFFPPLLPPFLPPSLPPKRTQGKGWFGGGADLTPYYLHDGDITSFHALYKGLCDAFDDTKVSPSLPPSLPPFLPPSILSFTPLLPSLPPFLRP